MKRISRVFPMIAGAIVWGALSHAQEPPAGAGEVDRLRFDAWESYRGHAE